MDAQLFTVTITAAQNAELGDRNLLLTNADGTAGAALPGMLSVVPPGTLAKQPASTERQATAAAVVTAPVPPATSLIAQSTAEPGDAAVAKWMAYHRNAQRSMSLV